MRLLVFAQAADARVDLAQLLRSARRYFDWSLDALEQCGVHPTGVAPENTRVRFRLTSNKEPWSAEFTLSARRAEARDHERARVAEERGRAGGMANLAQRCAYVWELEPELGVPEHVTWQCAALLAYVALGPVLPEDDSSLFGVRGARERAARSAAERN